MHIISHKPGYVSPTWWPWIISNKGIASIRKGHCIGKEKDTWTLFTPVTTSLCIDPIPIYPHDERRCYHNDKESMSTGMASITSTTTKSAVTCEQSNEAAGGVAHCLQDVWKMGHTCGSTDPYVWVTGDKRMHTTPQYTQGPRLPQHWWDSIGGREHRWPCLIRFSLGCIQPEGWGWMCCANKVVIHQCCQSHRTWLSYTPYGCGAEASVTLVAKPNISMPHSQPQEVKRCWIVFTRIPKEVTLTSKYYPQGKLSL